MTQDDKNYWKTGKKFFFNYTLNLKAKNLSKYNTCIDKMFNRPVYVWVLSVCVCVCVCLTEFMFRFRFRQEFHRNLGFGFGYKNLEPKCRLITVSAKFRFRSITSLIVDYTGFPHYSLFYIWMWIAKRRTASPLLIHKQGVRFH